MTDPIAAMYTTLWRTIVLIVLIVTAVGVWR